MSGGRHLDVARRWQVPGVTEHAGTVIGTLGISVVFFLVTGLGSSLVYIVTKDHTKALWTWAMLVLLGMVMLGIGTGLVLPVPCPPQESCAPTTR